MLRGFFLFLDRGALLVSSSSSPTSFLFSELPSLFASLSVLLAVSETTPFNKSATLLSSLLSEKASFNNSVIRSSILSSFSSTTSSTAAFSSTTSFSSNSSFSSIPRTSFFCLRPTSVVVSTLLPNILATELRISKAIRPKLTAESSTTGTTTSAFLRFGYVSAVAEGFVFLALSSSFSFFGSIFGGGAIIGVVDGGGDSGGILLFFFVLLLLTHCPGFDRLYLFRRRWR
mmetsp:Transcript_21828/g.24508  ORF Transcript_21828/g.24508 Transcript_21828/m.24508 type:complete len:230 (+) Transcript_21828:2582-3271(+)